MPGIGRRNFQNRTLWKVLRENVQTYSLTLTPRGFFLITFSGFNDSLILFC